jgi:hypothetical protein
MLFDQLTAGDGDDFAVGEDAAEDSQRRVVLG